MVIASNYIDFNSVDNPIKTFYRFDSKYFYYSNYEEFAYLIRPNEYSLEDDVFSLRDPKVGRFYTAERLGTTDLDTEPAGTSFRLILKLHQEFNEYHRSLLTFSEAIGIVGGIYEIIILIFKLFLSIFSTRIFEYYLVKRLSVKTANDRHQKFFSSKVHSYQIVEENKKGTQSEKDLAMIQSNKFSHSFKSTIKKSVVVKPEPLDSFRKMI